MMTGCSQDYSLQKSVFINDTDNPGLPVYSEWGYNTFGTYIDRKAFISNTSDLPAKIIVNKDTFNLLFKGSWKGEDVTLKFAILGYAPADYPDLIALNDSTIDLTASRCIVTFSGPFLPVKFDIYEGNLFFKRIQNLYVDKVLTESILSGTFNFKTFMGGEPVAFSNGRFDVGIGYDNFFKF